MRADLDRPVPGVCHVKTDLAATRIELEVAGTGNDFAGYHGFT
jgi:hypothetical protein